MKMPKFWNARLELVNQKKRKEEQAKREIEKQSRLKKIKDTKLSCSHDENEDNVDLNVENKNELLTNQKKILKNRNKLKKEHSSSSSENDVFPPGFSEPTEVFEQDSSPKKQQILGKEEVDAKKSPPVVLPKPKLKKKPKLPPAKSPIRTTNGPSMIPDLAAQISRVKLKHDATNDRQIHVGIENTDGVVNTAEKSPKKPTPPKKPIFAHQAQRTNDNVTQHNTRYPLKRQDSAEDEFTEDALYSTVGFSSLGYRSVQDDSDSDGPYAVSDIIKLNPRNGTQPDQKEKTSKQVNNSPKTKPATTDLVARDGLDTVHISSNLGIKEVQAIVKNKTSYCVGENKDVYSLPIKTDPSDKDTQQLERNQDADSAGQCNHAEQINPLYCPANVTNMNEEHATQAGNTSHTETVRSENIPSNIDYEMPGTVIKISPPTPKRRTHQVECDLKPPNFKPPPPPPGSSPILEGRNRGKKKPVKTPPPTEMPKQRKQKFGRNDLSSSNESLNSRTDTKHVTDSNHNHPDISRKPIEMNSERLGASPPTLRFPHYYAELEMPPIVAPPPSSTPLLNSHSMIVPPPPPMTEESNTPLVIPPPPMFPPPQLHSTNQAKFNMNSQKPYENVDAEWRNMVEYLPPPPPELLEMNPLYESVSH